MLLGSERIGDLSEVFIQLSSVINGNAPKLDMKSNFPKVSLYP